MIEFTRHNKKCHIGICMDGTGLVNKDLMHLISGNPGIGGTEYCQLLLAYYLNQSGNVDVTLISHAPLKIQGNVANLLIHNQKQLLDHDGQFNFIIITTPIDSKCYTFLDSFKKTKFITWSHNYFNSRIAHSIYKCNAVALNVFVSKQMYDFYIDNDVILKSTYIFNIVVDSLGDCQRKPIANTLVFMGNISRQKGIIELLKIWQIIEKEIPDAKLSIIGKGNLYGGTKLGSLNIADQDTENAMAKYILDETGKIKQSIKFCGILGHEKYDLFLHSSVGILNPSARTETFGLGIVEMATAKLPVVTKNWNAHPDTALNGRTALLGHTITDMAHKIICLFKNPDLNIRLGEEGKRQVIRFAADTIIPLWLNVINKLCFNTSQIDNYKSKILPVSKPYWNNYKFLRSFNSKLRFNLKLRFLPSIVSVETFANDSIKKLRSIHSAIRR